MTSSASRQRMGLNLGPESCVIYCRISSDRTGEQLGVARQEREARGLAQRLGLHVDRVLIDNDISATSGARRPAFEELLSSRPEAVVAWHQDRLLRLTSDLERVIDLGVPVYTVVAGTLDLATPAGRAVARTVAAWSQYEGEQKAERQRAANFQRAERGQWTFSRRPYGYMRVDGKIVQVPEEAKAIQEAFGAYLSGESYQAIADDWNHKGRTTTLGYPWLPVHVMRMMANPRLAGIVVYRGEELPDVEPSWKPTISRRTWSDYCEVKKGRKRSGAPSAGKPKHLLSGIARCGVCGDSLYRTSIQRKPRKDGTRAEPFKVYDCTRNRCVSIAAPSLDEFMEQLVLARLRDKKIISRLRETPNIAPIKAELEELRRRRANVANLVGDGLLSRREAREKLTELGQLIENAEARFAAMRRKSPLGDLALAKSVPSRWRKMSVVERRRVIADLGVSLRINRGTRGHRGLDTSRIRVEWTTDEV